MDEIAKIRSSSSDGLLKMSILGSGAYGKVYSAMNKDGYKIAVKRSNISKSYNGSTNCLQEFDTLQVVRDYPFFIQIVGLYFMDPFTNSLSKPNHRGRSSSSGKKGALYDKMYLAMEMGDTDAYHWIHKKNSRTGIPYTISEDDKKLFMVHTLLSLEFLHSREIYHRDIKPNNIIIFLNDKGGLKSAKITDFGLSTSFSHQPMSVPGVTTSWYRAPEVSLNKNYDYKSDIWSLACIFYELICFPDNKFLVSADKDTDLLRFHWCNFSFPEDDYYIYNELYKDEESKKVKTVQTVKPISNNKNISYSNFNDINVYRNQQCGNLGIKRLLPANTDEKLANMLDMMFVVTDKNRASATACLNHPYFESCRELITSMRNKFRINDSGEWILKPVYKFCYKSCVARKVGMKWFIHVYSNRHKNPVSEWYSHRTLFQAIRLFDQYLISDLNIKEFDEQCVIMWVNVFLFTAYKYFNVMLTNKNISSFTIGLKDTFTMLSKGLSFEEHCLKNFFVTGIYSKTIYEYSPEYLTDSAIEVLLRVIANEEIPSGTPLSDFWARYECEINLSNKTSYFPHKKSI